MENRIYKKKLDDISIKSSMIKTRFNPGNDRAPLGHLEKSVHKVELGG